ncbi:MAG TPA: hypothetical protein VJ904_12015, partial [Tichowtungia sp.]|nr:hypothetical protein [Tichowtungia sp.]
MIAVNRNQRISGLASRAKISRALPQAQAPDRLATSQARQPGPAVDLQLLVEKPGPTITAGKITDGGSSSGYGFHQHPMDGRDQMCIT